jgi:hypothetical protein
MKSTERSVAVGRRVAARALGGVRTSDKSDRSSSGELPLVRLASVSSLGRRRNGGAPVLQSSANDLRIPATVKFPDELSYGAPIAGEDRHARRISGKTVWPKGGRQERRLSHRRAQPSASGSARRGPSLWDENSTSDIVPTCTVRSRRLSH